MRHTEVLECERKRLLLKYILIGCPIGLQYRCEWTAAASRIGTGSEDFFYFFEFHAMFTAGSRALPLPHHWAVNYFTFGSCVTSLRSLWATCFTKGSISSSSLFSLWDQIWTNDLAVYRSRFFSCLYMWPAHVPWSCLAVTLAFFWEGVGRQERRLFKTQQTYSLLNKVE